MTATTPRPRRSAARAIVLDEDNRVMLLRYDENGGFLATPGGSLDDGETDAQAVARELLEELGVRDVTVGAHLATRVAEHPVAGQAVRQSERYYLVRVRAASVDPRNAGQADNIREWRWLSLPELLDADETVYPAGLPCLLKTVIETGPPATPVALS